MSLEFAPCYACSIPILHLLLNDYWLGHFTGGLIRTKIPKLPRRLVCSGSLRDSDMTLSDPRLQDSLMVGKNGCSIHTPHYSSGKRIFSCQDVGSFVLRPICKKLHANRLQILHGNTLHSRGPLSRQFGNSKIPCIPSPIQVYSLCVGNFRATANQAIKLSTNARLSFWTLTYSS